MSVIADYRDAAAGLPTLEKVAHDPTAWKNQTFLGQTHVAIRESGLGLTSTISMKGAAYIDCYALVLGRVVAAFTRGNLPSLLKRLRERPMESALFEALKTNITTEAKRSYGDNARSA